MSKSNVRAIDQRVDQSSRKLADFLGDRFGLTYDVSASKCQHDRNSEPECRWHQHMAETRRDRACSLRGCIQCCPQLEHRSKAAEERRANRERRKIMEPAGELRQN